MTLQVYGVPAPAISRLIKNTSYLNPQPPYSRVPGSRNWQVETADWIWPVY